jgi:type I restriction enzyme, S subunit
VPLGAIADYVNGYPFKPEQWGSDGLPIIRIQNLNSPDTPFNYFSGTIDSRYQVVSGDLLISWSASLDAYVWNRGSAVLNQHIFKVVERTDLVRRDYLYFAVKFAMAEIRSQVHGATMRHITKPEFEAVEIALPPLHEQRRIAVALTEQMAAMARVRAAAEAQLEAAKSLSQSCFNSVFAAAGAENWTYEPLGTVSDVLGGIQKSPDRAPKDFHCPYLTVRNVQRGHLDLHQVERFEVSPAELERLRLIQGDILVVEGNGSMDHIGRNAMFDGEISDCIHQNHVIRVRPHLSVIYPPFLSRYLNSTGGIAQMREKAMTTSGLYTLSVGKVGALTVPVPPIEEQKRIAGVLADQATTIAHVQASVRDQLDAINRLPNIFLQRAFSGELF